MKKVFSILIVALLTLPAFTQELSPREQRKLQKQLKKEQQADELAKTSAVVTAMVEQAAFVLEAHTLRDKRGESVQVSSSLNFIAVESATGSIQVGSNTGFGPNGVGGITAQGQVVDYKASQHEKSGNYNISYYLQSPIGTFDVRLTAFPNGRAEATISNATMGGRLTYSGNLVPPGMSTVYKGMSL